MCEFRHIFLKYAQSPVFPLKYAISGQENVRSLMLLEGKTLPGSTLLFRTRFSGLQNPAMCGFLLGEFLR
jgi:hypothetical protein